MRRFLPTAALAAILGLNSLIPAAHAQVDQDDIEETDVDINALGIPDYNLDPETFDLATTTDTEVRWMRIELESLEFAAILRDSFATGAVNSSLRVRNAAAEEVKVAQIELEDRQESLGIAAIEGFLSTTEGNLNDVMSPDIEAIADDSLANFTTEEIVEDRDAARDRLDDARDVLDSAEGDLSVARTDKRETAAELVEASEARSRFDVRADEHGRIAEAADARAAALGNANATLLEGEELPEGQTVRNSNVELRSVAGVFNVNVTIEDELDALIAHARADGVFLAGGAYRTVESQIALRLAHCGGATPPAAATGGTEGLAAGTAPAAPQGAAPSTGTAPEPSPSNASRLIPSQDDSGGGDPATTTPPATEPPATEPPATEPPAADPPATDPPAGDQPSTDAPTPGDGAPADGSTTEPPPELPSGDDTATDGEGTGANSAAWRNYVIYEVPASACSPPTAPPGRSQHQTGLAIDFTENGSILTWSSTGFFWLEANAADFGLFNLPSEAWHWSTTGN